MINSYRLTIVLILAISISSFGVIYSSHNSRQSFIAWQDLLKQAQAYEVEWGQLLIEQSTEASYTHLEKKAVNKLNMVAPSTKQIVVVRGSEK